MKYLISCGILFYPLTWVYLVVAAPRSLFLAIFLLTFPIFSLAMVGGWLVYSCIETCSDDGAFSRLWKWIRTPSLIVRCRYYRDITAPVETAEQIMWRKANLCAVTMVACICSHVTIDLFQTLRGRNLMIVLSSPLR